jgi:hypothetical protein
MSYCTPCPPCDLEFPLLCEPLETTANGKRLVVEDSAACQKTIQTPVAQQVLKTDGAGNLTWTNGDNTNVLKKSPTGLVEFGKVETDYILDDAITTVKIVDDAITTAKIVDGAVVGSKIPDKAITNAKLRDSAGLSVIGRSANSTGQVADIVASTTGSVLVRGGTSLGFALIQESNIANGEITAPKLSGAQTGTAPIFGIRAWVSFAGAGANGPAAIEQSGNVSGVTKNADGNYTITFTTALPTDNYAVMGSSSETSGTAGTAVVFVTRATTSCEIIVASGASLIPKNRVTAAFIV